MQKAKTDTMLQMALQTNIYHHLKLHETMGSIFQIIFLRNNKQEKQNTHDPSV